MEKILSMFRRCPRNVNSQGSLKSPIFWWCFNTCGVTGLLLHPLKISENLWFSDVFRRYRKRSVAWNGLTYSVSGIWCTSSKYLALFPANIYLFHVNIRTIRKRCEPFKLWTNFTFYCWLWTYFTLFFSFSIVDFELVIVTWIVPDLQITFILLWSITIIF